jgi:hypothetical protein
MNAQAASVGSLLAILALSDHRVLHTAWSTPFTSGLGWSELRKPVYLAFQAWAARYPDHVFDSAWQRLSQCQFRQASLPLALLVELRDEFLEWRHGEARVRRDQLGAWQQGLASRMSTLPVRAAADLWARPESVGDGMRTIELQRNRGDRPRVPWQRQVLPMVRPDEPPVSAYIDREGLHETHLHLNGSTHAEVCWLRALGEPRAESEEFVKAWTGGANSARLHDLVEQANPGLTPHVFYRHLRVAGRLRAWLKAASEHRIAPNTRFPVSCHDLDEMDESEWSVGLPTPDSPWNQSLEIGDELGWMSRLLAALQAQPRATLSRMLHTYLLLMHEHYRLLVQGEPQYGFDQFQKFTLTELRAPAERDYKSRFLAMHGCSTISKVGYLEGRFAPKDSLQGVEALLRSILGGYCGYLHEVGVAGQTANPNPKPRTLSDVLAELERYFAKPPTSHRAIHRLTLVAHFIKQPWSPTPRHLAGPYRHHALDKRLRQVTGVLLRSLSIWPRLRTWVRGVDAAANELHAPADVFAPVYRVCQRAGLTRRSYHAGEDFRHLLSGIAAIWEALTLLDLRDGDRIGHGTAMGIRPSLWLDRMPDRLTLTRGEWMFGVLAGWQLLRDLPDMQATAHRLQGELEATAREVFCESIPARDLEGAMALRGLCRQSLLRHKADPERADSEPLSDLWREEAAAVRRAWDEQPRQVELLWRWLSDEGIQERSDEWISKEAAFLDAPAYLRLQQALMQAVADRSVLIETLPSSNVRISQYYSIDEHHALRWMRVPGHVEAGDPAIMTCLGSDDPGIFAGDLETEFYLLYATLRRQNTSDVESLQRVSELNERGRIYRFHDPFLT